MIDNDKNQYYYNHLENCVVNVRWGRCLKLCGSYVPHETFKDLNYMLPIGWYCILLMVLLTDFVSPELQKV